MNCVGNSRPGETTEWVPEGENAGGLEGKGPITAGQSAQVKEKWQLAKALLWEAMKKIFKQEKNHDYSGTFWILIYGYILSFHKYFKYFA